ncbi:hypothetical protein EUX98_g7219 [Antrodiella citrinella]|uniref:RING-type domain-containing protein n=1 Tax=Antrodiella citrinella TaxID=2447956 RepID=A0A4S4MM51_9APHY|nr:hypothetical protein EUX98_g7219 [Antrodiella citrinella]
MGHLWKRCVSQYPRNVRLAHILSPFKIENPSDDPRQYHIPGGGAEFPGDDENPLNPLDFLMGLQAAMPEIRPSSPRARDRPRSPQFTSNASTFSIRIDRTGDGPARTVFSSSRSPPTRADSIPGMFERGGNGNGRRPEGANITGALMFQYLATLLAQSGRNMPPNPMFAEMMGGAEPGRMGDYVFSQEALDQIMTQLMESSSSHPVAATEEIIQNLPKVVLEEGSLLLEKDCAVCKDQFQLGTEDPSEQVVITLPCKHPFHEGCIVPWLKSSGTCPVCRYV